MPGEDAKSLLDTSHAGIDLTSIEVSHTVWTDFAWPHSAQNLLPLAFFVALAELI